MRGRLSCAALLALIVTAPAAPAREVVDGPTIELEYHDAMRLRIQRRLAQASGLVFTACETSAPGLKARLEFGVQPNGLLRYVDLAEPSGRKECDEAMVRAIHATAPYAEVAELSPRRGAVIVARLEAGSFAGIIRRAPVAPPGRTPTLQDLTPPPSAVEFPIVPVVVVVAVGILAAVGMWSVRQRRDDRPSARAEGHAAPLAGAMVMPRRAASTTSGVDDRFRLTIDFSDRQAMQDFVTILRRDELLPGDAQTHRVDPATLAVSAATETYVVIRPDSAA